MCVCVCVEIITSHQELGDYYTGEEGREMTYQEG